MKNLFIISFFLIMICSCSSGGKNRTETPPEKDSLHISVPRFSPDSALAYVKRQVDFGPRVPNTQGHVACGDWLKIMLERQADQVIVQNPILTAFDGTRLNARNFFARFSPEKTNRVLLLAHWDCRPWADQDPDPNKHRQPVDGANDGASGVAVLLETARHLKMQKPEVGIDILFVDAEDWGTENDEDSWALGAKYFVQNPPLTDYAPSHAILLDMVGGKDAIFPFEYFSQLSAPAILEAFHRAAGEAGFSSYFPEEAGGAVTDDHLQLINVGIPAIDIIEYHSASGFNPTWHTTSDTFENISPETLKAVGQSLLHYIYSLRE